MLCIDGQGRLVLATGLSKRGRVEVADGNAINHPLVRKLELHRRIR